MDLETLKLIGIIIIMTCCGILGYLIGKMYSICDTFEMYLKSEEYDELLPKYENLKKTIEIKEESENEEEN